MMTTMSKQCVIDPAHRLDADVFVKRGTPIHRCRDCGCIMADTAFQQAQYESGTYYSMAFRTRAAIEREWGFRWRTLLRWIVRDCRPRSVLDVGAGNGYFVALAAREFGLDATGIEISAEEIRFARDVLDVELFAETVEQHRRQYDVVTCFNVLEHVADPQALLAAALARVKPGGSLVLTTPNPGCIHARIKGVRRWNMVDPPHHLNLFTRQALATLLGRHGLTLVRYDTLSTYINFVRRIDTRKLLFRRLFFHVLRAGGLGADHLVIARKPST